MRIQHPLSQLLTPVLAARLIVLLGLSSVGVALVMQHYLGMEPCPLCIVQRYAALACALAALPLALSGQCAVYKGRAWVAGGAGVMALFGLLTAGRHMWIQAYPPESEGCAPGLDYMLERFPLTDVLPAIFRGSASCTAVDTLFWGITIPQAGAALFLTMLALTWVARKPHRISENRR